ncbi:MAG: hypothetical protein AB7K04_05485 [Pseudorhodoplanes sp.]
MIFALIVAAIRNVMRRRGTLAALLLAAMTAIAAPPAKAAIGDKPHVIDAREAGGMANLSQNCRAV